MQAVRNARPKWVTGLLITVLIPAGFQGLEYGMHWLRGTPHLRAAEIASVIMSALSALFNWYAMRRGAFDYLPKPFTPDQLRLVLERVARERRLQSPPSPLRL